MRISAFAFSISFGITAAVFMAGAVGLGNDFWGINHLTYLPSVNVYVLVGIFIAGFVGALAIGRFSGVSIVSQKVSDFIWEESIWKKVSLVLILSSLFYALRLEIFFLGDGYTLLSVFSQGEAYLHKWTVPISTYLIRAIQKLYGVYTYDTAKTTFQLLSIICGAITIFNFIGIIGLLTSDHYKRLLGLTTFIFSGTLLLFVGYVEFYPLVWAAISTFLRLAFKYLNNQSSIIWVYLTFAVAVGIHLQSLIFLGGLVVLTIPVILKDESLSIRPRAVIFTGLLLIVGIFIILSITDFLSKGEIVLPMIADESDPANYAVLGATHFVDIVNQIILIFPGILMLLSLGKFKFGSARVSSFLIANLIGGVLWLIFINPGLGMGRDWDLFSISVLPIGLASFYAVCDESVQVSERQSVSYSSFCFVIAVSFLSVNLISNAAEGRFLELLRRYGAKDYTGWSMLSYYYYNLNQYDSSEAIAGEMAQYFPARGRVIDAQNALKRNDTRRAIDIGLDLLREEPKNREVLHLLAMAYNLSNNFELSEKYYIETLKVHRHSRIANELGQLYLKRGQFDKAIDVFKDIHKADPSLTNVMEGLGLAYFKKGNNEAALAVADSLFMKDGNSPGGHLLKMVVAVELEIKDSALVHYREFLRYGRGRSDYENIKEYYSYLM
jgi:Tfp pilus assembly protein PilF